MTPLALLILIGLLVDHAVHLVADHLNERALSPEVPEVLRDEVDAETWARAQEYTRARGRFGRVVSALDLGLLLGVWFAGGFGWLDSVTRGFGWGELPTGLAYLGLLGLGLWLVGLPARWWSAFRVEARFGFNQRTTALFWADELKGLLLGAVLGGALAALVLWLFGLGGDWAWAYVWAAVTVFTVALQYVAPTWILPLFNEFRPLEEGELLTRVRDLARRTEFPLTEVSVMDGSKRSTKANAFFTGFGRRKRIALFDTLVERHGPEELECVLAHEIGHWSHGHMWKGALLGIAQTGLWLWLLGWALQAPALFEAFHVGTPSVHAGLVLFGILVAPANLVLGPLFAAFSRRNEYQADAFAREVTGRPEDLVRALVRLSKESLSNLTPHPFYVWLHHSHPPLLARVAALRAGAR